MHAMLRNVKASLSHLARWFRNEFVHTRLHEGSAMSSELAEEFPASENFMGKNLSLGECLRKQKRAY